jgi:exopolyphosphatase/guanosine-5'-triphosphate,3'-diphosphate pyrophosphatase
MIRASIDLGTNTCLLLIAEWDPSVQQVKKVISDTVTIVRLGEGVDRNREFQSAPMERTLSCLKTYAAKVRSSGLDPKDSVCVATSQARDARNSSHFFAQIEKETGFRFRVITGEEEAQATFLGALLPGMDPKESFVIDIGGGSTEIISLQSAQSVDIGSVRFTERFFKSGSTSPVTDDEFWACQDAVDSNLETFMPMRKKFDSQPGHLVGVAGTVTTLAAWYLGLERFDPSRIDGLVLTRGDVHRMVEELKWRTVEERKSLPGMEPLRADVILAGALILWRSMEILNFPSCQVSTRGLRFGVLRY